MRFFIKHTCRICFAILACPLWFGYEIQRVLMGKSHALASWSQILSLIPGMFGTYLRFAFYSRAMGGVGEDAVISFGVLFSHPETTIGRTAYIGPYCVIGDVSLGDDVLLGSQVSVMNGARQHGIGRLDVPVREQPGEWPKITIGQDTWIGDHAIVMADIGEHCVIGAGSVVTKPVPDYAIAVGNPAKVVKYREGAPGLLPDRELNQSEHA